MDKAQARQARPEQTVRLHWEQARQRHMVFQLVLMHLAQERVSQDEIVLRLEMPQVALRQAFVLARVQRSWPVPQCRL